MAAKSSDNSAEAKANDRAEARAKARAKSKVKTLLNKGHSPKKFHQGLACGLGRGGQCSCRNQIITIEREQGRAAKGKLKVGSTQADFDQLKN